MNIGIVCYPTYGGSGIVATELGKALAKKGHSIHFISSSQPVRLDVFKERIFYHEVHVADYPLFEYVPYESALTSKLVDIVKNERLDILHVHYALPHASAAYMAQQILQVQGITIPFVTTLHGTDITVVGKDASYEPVISFAIEHSNAVTAVSTYLKEATYEHFKVTKEIHVIPNFINFTYCDRFEHDNELRKTFAPNNERILIHVSNLRKVKRVEDVITTFCLVEKEVPSVLLIVGEGPERTRLEHLCRELGIQDKVHLLGNIKKVEKVLKASDLFFLPSEQESFGLSALEAMAAGVPVISSNVGGLPEVNIHGYSGFLSDVGDTQDMATHAITLLHDTELLARFRQQAHTQAKKFCIHEILPLYENIYATVLGEA